MKNKTLAFIILVSSFLMSCDNKVPIQSDLNQVPFIPHPMEVNSLGSGIAINDIAGIKVDVDSEEWIGVAEYLSTYLNDKTGNAIAVSDRGNLIITDQGSSEIPDEGYKIEINDNEVKVIASTAKGCFYAVQTIKQMLPMSKNDDNEEEVPWHFPTGSISDFPQYGYRGMMLDVARHFFTVEEVKELVDRLAEYKFNHLHLHLTDDQGWRIEIKSWPKLTEMGAKTEVGGGEGGYYTQDDYQAIVAYAAERYITIVPEVDMPGHTNAALASYAALNCDRKARELYTGIEVGFSTLCVRSETTYEFVDDVVREISAITPGPYFHIGGDESHVTEKNDYVYFINRVFGIVQKYNKTVLGWDEIATADFGEGMIAQYWADADNAQMALEKGGKLLMSPAKYAYLDMQYDSTSQYGLHWAAYIEVDDGYRWSPDTLVTGLQNDDIIGIEAPLWSETVSNLKEAEYLIYPRLLGYAEIGWTSKDLRDWEDYKIRLSKHGKRLKAEGIAYYSSDRVNWIE